MNIKLAKTAIIAGDAELAEQVCSRLRTPGVYLPVVEAPMVRLVVVFNNACSSWRALAIKFSCGGASVYVGTSTDILNAVGVLIANKFVDEVTSGRAIGLALHRAQKKLVGEFCYTPYLMSGYLYTQLNNPPLKQRHRRVALRILDAIEAANRERMSDERPTVLRFLKDELRGLNKVSARL